MAAETLHRLVQTLRTTLDSDTRTDAELLARFRRDRDPAAVEVIVRRHGPRVLAACRKVLGADAEADDAFQATFLVLLRDPAAVRRKASLGAWLYGVAHRISLHARSRGLRRRGRTVPETVAPADDLPWREACAILHEELDRLPDATRLPLVLCYLEGLSRDEAALQLGRTLHSVKKALEKGREQLRKRLIRRGVTLSTGLLSAVAAPVAVESAEVSRAVLDGVIRPSAGVTALARAVRPVFPVRTVLAACLGVAAVSIGLAVADGPKPPDPPPKEQPARPIAMDSPPPKAAMAKPPAAEPEVREPAPVARANDPPPDVLTYRGRAVTLDGKPVEGAQVFLHVTSLYPRPFVPRARSDADGRFAFDVRRSELDPRGYELSAEPWRNGHLIGSAPGLGVAWTRDLTPGQDAELPFIKDDVPIEGRVLNLEGKPVAGARIRTLWVFHPVGGNLDGWLERLPSLTGLDANWKALNGLEGVSKTNLPGLPGLYPLRRRGFDPAVPTVTTGPDGRFTVRGIGRDRVALLQVEGEGIENRPTPVVTRPIEPLVVPSFTLDTISGSFRSRAREGPPTEAVYGRKFDLAVGPDRPVVGVVTDRDTGKPVAGAVVTSGADAYGIWDRHLARTKTGADGRFRLTGLPMRDNHALRVEPPADQPYLPIMFSVPAQPGLDSIEVNPRLKRGVSLTGKVFDRDTKAGIRAHFRYAAAPDNPHLPPGNHLTYEALQYTRADDGTFRTAVLPGRGYVTVSVEPPQDKEYERGQGALSHLGDGIVETKPENFSTYSLHSLARLDVAPDAPEVKLEVPLTPGRSAPVSVRGPDGQALGGVVVTAEPGGPRSEKLGSKGTLMVRPRQYLQAVCPESRLAGRLRLMGNEKGPVTLTLEPWRTATGRILDAAGKPVPDAVLSFGDPDPRPADGEPDGFWYPGQPVRTDKDGRYRIDGLVPGAPYALLVWARGRPGQTIRFRADWKAGEVKDLGALKPGQ